ncbi:MAG TPA: ferrous iron transport protein A [Treponema sp.]|nr:ferrous iron transport protein A [Treponema sp.]
MKLSQLVPGKCGVIKNVGGEDALRHHLLDMGLTPGTRILVRKTAPLGDPLELNLRGYELTLRRDDAEKVELEQPDDPYSCRACSAAACPYCKGSAR